MTSLDTRNSIDFPVPDPEDQQVWSASLGLDLADRTVLEAEVLIWRIVRQRARTAEERASEVETKKV